MYFCHLSYLPQWLIIIKLIISFRNHWKLTTYTKNVAPLFWLPKPIIYPRGKLNHEFQQVGCFLILFAGKMLLSNWCTALRTFSGLKWLTLWTLTQSFLHHSWFYCIILLLVFSASGSVLMSGGALTVQLYSNKITQGWFLITVIYHSYRLADESFTLLWVLQI